MDCEKKRLEGLCELTGKGFKIDKITFTDDKDFLFYKCSSVLFLAVAPEPKDMQILTELLHEMMASYDLDVKVEDYDAYDLYLMGMISRRLGDLEGATTYVTASIKGNCYIWGAWIELAFLVTDRKNVK